MGYELRYQDKWDAHDWNAWIADGRPPVPDNLKSSPLIDEPDSRVPHELSPEIIVPKTLLPAGFGLNTKPRRKTGNPDKILAKYGIR